MLRNSGMVERAAETDVATARARIKRLTLTLNNGSIGLAAVHVLVFVVVELHVLAAIFAAAATGWLAARPLIRRRISVHLRAGRRWCCHRRR